jgi:formamidopyrimidine-DNA glycosylase
VGRHRAHQRKRNIMPELPEVETTVRGLATVLEGQAIARVRVNRPICAARSPPIWRRR